MTKSNNHPNRSKFIGWGIIGEPQADLLVAGPEGKTIDVTGYSAADYWRDGKFLGPDIYGIVPIYAAKDGQFPADATQYPYFA